MKNPILDTIKKYWQPFFETIPNLESSQIPDLDAKKVSSCVLDELRIPNLGASIVIDGIFNSLRVPNLNASKVIEGIFNPLRIPDLDASYVTSGVFNINRIPPISVSLVPDFETPNLTSIATLPSGIIIVHTSNTIPDGWLICDGRAISRVDCSDLFNAISITWGSGDGSTTFNIPNLSCRTLLGAGGVRINGPQVTVGSLGGNEEENILLPRHRHSILSHNHSTLNHSHRFSDSSHSHSLASHKHSVSSHNHCYFNWFSFS